MCSMSFNVGHSWTFPKEENRGNRLVLYVGALQAVLRQVASCTYVIWYGVSYMQCVYLVTRPALQVMVRPTREANLDHGSSRISLRVYNLHDLPRVKLESRSDETDSHWKASIQAFYLILNSSFKMVVFASTRYSFVCFRFLLCVFSPSPVCSTAVLCLSSRIRLH